jgi:hypothetical protein
MRSVGSEVRPSAKRSSRYSRTTPAISFSVNRSNSAMPRSSWTTWSPGLRSARSVPIRDGEALRERHVEDRELAGGRRLGQLLERGDDDVALAEEVRDARRLRRRDDPRVRRARRDLAQERVEPARVARDVPPPQRDRVASRADAYLPALGGETLDRVAADVWRGERADREPLLAQLLAALLGELLVRVPREVELDRVLEYDCGPLGEVIEQRRRCAEQRRERLQAGGVRALAHRLDDRAVSAELLVRREILPALLGEALGEVRCALERDLARREHGDGFERVLASLRDGIEAADRLDVVAEELDADRALRSRRVDVHDPAAP